VDAEHRHERSRAARARVLSGDLSCSQRTGGCGLNCDWPQSRRRHPARHSGRRAAHHDCPARARRGRDVLLSVGPDHYGARTEARSAPRVSERRCAAPPSSHIRMAHAALRHSAAGSADRRARSDVHAQCFATRASKWACTAMTMCAGRTGWRMPMPLGRSANSCAAVDTFGRGVWSCAQSHARAGWQLKLLCATARERCAPALRKRHARYAGLFAGHRQCAGRSVQDPTTLPTLDELIGTDGLTADTACDELRREDALHPMPDQVFTAQRKLEGGQLAPQFERLLRAGWRMDLPRAIARYRRRPRPGKSATSPHCDGRDPRPLGSGSRCKGAARGRADERLMSAQDAAARRGNAPR